MPDDKCPRILVVDDDADWREFLRLSLEDLGYCAVEASSGEQALEFMRREAFPVVLLDMNMPGMSGQEVIKHLPRPLPRIVLLTSAAAEEVGGTLGTTQAYYLPKDAGPDALSLILQSLQP